MEKTDDMIKINGTWFQALCFDRKIYDPFGLCVIVIFFVEPDIPAGVTNNLSNLSDLVYVKCF